MKPQLFAITMFTMTKKHGTDDQAHPEGAPTRGGMRGRDGTGNGDQK